MAVSFMSTVVNDEGYETRLFKIKDGSKILCLDYNKNFDYCRIDKIQFGRGQKIFNVKIKNNIDQEYRLVCDEKTEILCKKNIGGVVTEMFIPIANIDMSCIIKDIIGRNCVIVKKYEITPATSTNKPEEFMKLNGDFSGLCCSSIVLRNV